MEITHPCPIVVSQTTKQRDKTTAVFFLDLGAALGGGGGRDSCNVDLLSANPVTSQSGTG